MRQRCVLPAEDSVLHIHDDLSRLARIRHREVKAPQSRGSAFPDACRETHAVPRMKLPTERHGASDRDVIDGRERHRAAVGLVARASFPADATLVDRDVPHAGGDAEASALELDSADSRRSLRTALLAVPLGSALLRRRVLLPTVAATRRQRRDAAFATQAGFPPAPLAAATQRLRCDDRHLRISCHAVDWRARPGPRCCGRYGRVRRRPSTDVLLFSRR